MENPSLYWYNDSDETKNPEGKVSQASESFSLLQSYYTDTNKEFNAFTI